MNRMIRLATLVAAFAMIAPAAHAAQSEHTNNGCYVQLAKDLGLSPSVTAPGQTSNGPGTGSGVIPGGFGGSATATC